MRFLDVTLPLDQGTPAFPGDPAFETEPRHRIEQGGFAVSALRLGSHTGTHVDAPSHCFPHGLTVDRLPFELLCGAASVVSWPPGVESGSSTGKAAWSLRGLPEGCTRLLLRTSPSVPSNRKNRSGAGGIDLETAAALIRHGIKLAGIDRLSIADGAEALPVHRLLLGAGVVILEGLDLDAAEPGPYRLLCLPLRLAGCDGAPARVVLITD